MRTVTLPIEEYNDLLKDQADKKRLMEELADAQKEIERLSLLCQEYSAKIARLANENFDLRHRGFFARLFNINKDDDQ